MKDFFGEYGHQLQVQNSDDLKIKLSAIDCTVPFKGRKTEDRERYCLKVYLLELNRMNLLTFPLKIIKPPKHSSPDFILKNGDGSTTGIEHTDATSENLQRATAIARQCPKETYINLSFFRHNQGKLSREQLKGGIILPREKNYNRGWEGDEDISDTVYFFKEAIFEKLKDLNKGHYLPADRYELLIYDNTQTALEKEDLKKALTILRNIMATELPKIQFSQKFDCVSIVCGNRLLHNVVTLKEAKRVGKAKPIA